MQNRTLDLKSGYLALQLGLLQRGGRVHYAINTLQQGQARINRGNVFLVLGPLVRLGSCEKVLVLHILHILHMHLCAY
jgi:hypothetical protein